MEAHARKGANPRHIWRSLQDRDDVYDARRQRRRHASVIANLVEPPESFVPKGPDAHARSCVACYATGSKAVDREGRFTHHEVGPLIPEPRASASNTNDRRRRRSPARHALRIDVERIDRMARGHEQAIAIMPAETDVGAALGRAARRGAPRWTHKLYQSLLARACRPQRQADSFKALPVSSIITQEWPGSPSGTGTPRRTRNFARCPP
jgi:hypothetical protein